MYKCDDGLYGMQQVRGVGVATAKTSHSKITEDYFKETDSDSSALHNDLAIFHDVHNSDL